MSILKSGSSHAASFCMEDYNKHYASTLNLDSFGDLEDYKYMESVTL